MKTIPVRSLTATLLLLCAASAAPATPVVFTGTVSYSGSHAADSIYVVVIDESTDVLLAIDRIAAGTPPYGRAFSLSFDNAGVGPDVGLLALIDRDGSGFDWAVGTNNPAADPLTPGDVLGWYAGQQDLVVLSPASSQTGLDFAMPTGEIHGTVTLVSGQTNPFILVTTQVGGDVAGEAEVAVLASGPYQVVGVYPGTWLVQGISDQGDICFGDPTCATPTFITLGLGEVRTGIDIDFSPLPVEAESWGSVKSLYR